MHGVRRVVVFCLLTTLLPSILIVVPLYLRNVRYADVMYRVSDSDVIQIHQGQSSIFCEGHSLKMNSTFNAFQMKGWPELSKKRRHIQLKKSMTLPDDTLEYWGFYLFKGATVELKACSRYEGSKILVVKGDKILNTCNILNNNKKVQTNLVNNQGNVVVTLEGPGNKKNTTRTDVQEDENNAAEETDDFNDKALLMLKETLQNSLNKVDSQNHSKYSTDLDYGPNKVALKENKTTRYKRDMKRKALHNPNTILDTGVNHGGNALNSTVHNEDISASSFENSLYECYSGNILINEFFPHAVQCKSSEYLEKTTILKVIHEVALDGYYYYIFYSDNDIVQNDIHIIFDIYKPTFQYTNLSESKRCLNSTDCFFDVSFLSQESVIVEVPTKDGIEYKEDYSILISTCHPRMSVYAVFPIAVLLSILLFAFL